MTPLFDRCQKENFDISEDEVNDIKGYLDNVKLLESFMKSFTINGKENNIDYVFMANSQMTMTNYMSLTIYIIRCEII